MVFGVKPQGNAFVAFALYEGEFLRKAFCHTRKEAENLVKSWRSIPPNL